MTDKFKESLSALIDGEASEIEVHQLLRQFSGDESLKVTWMTYQQIRAIVRGEGTLSSEQHRDLHSRISEAISTETLPEFVESRGSVFPAALVKPAAGLAVAASLAAAVFFGVQSYYSPGTPSGVPKTAENEPVVVAQPVSTGAVDTREFARPADDDTLDIKELDAEKQRLLRAYLSQHDRMVRMNPNARFVTFDAPPSK